MRKQNTPVAGRSPVARALTAGFDLAVGVGVFTFGGYWLDQRRGGGMRWTLWGALLGFLYVGYELWKVLRGLRDEEKRRAERSSAGPKARSS